jgi:hypothetical protein
MFAPDSRFSLPTRDAWYDGHRDLRHRRGEATMADQGKLTVGTDGTGRTYIRVERSRAQALAEYLGEQGFSSTRHQESEDDVLTLGNADPEEVQKLVDEWAG